MTAPNEASFTRRAVLASAGAGAAALGAKPALAQTGQSKTFVLVHGAWQAAGAGGASRTSWKSRGTRCSRRRSRASANTRTS